MRRRQAGLRPAAVEAAAFFGDLRRYRYGMKMKRQEKDREKQQQPDQAAASGAAGFHAGRHHKHLLTQVWIGCQNQNPLPDSAKLAHESLRKPVGVNRKVAPATCELPDNQAQFGHGRP
jgi:hypothetical protein